MPDTNNVWRVGVSPFFCTTLHSMTAKLALLAYQTFRASDYSIGVHMQAHQLHLIGGRHQLSPRWKWWTRLTGTVSSNAQQLLATIMLRLTLDIFLKSWQRKITAAISRDLPGLKYSKFCAWRPEFCFSFCCGSLQRSCGAFGWFGRLRERYRGNRGRGRNEKGGGKEERKGQHHQVRKNNRRLWLYWSSLASKCRDRKHRLYSLHHTSEYTGKTIWQRDSIHFRIVRIMSNVVTRRIKFSCA